jgi:hypothetical protein
VKKIDALRGLILKFTKIGEAREMHQQLRALTAAATKAGKDLPSFLDGMQRLADLNETETSTWKEGYEIAQGASGRVDACDLIVWLTMAKEAGVPIIPAEEILVLSQEEMSIAGGLADIDPSLHKTRSAAKIRNVLEAAYPGMPDMPAPPTQADVESVLAKLYAAMDDVPEGWMVRSSRCGPGSLKALAGVGLAGSSSPEVRFNANIEVGPGWIRDGNRRRVDTTDHRIIQGAAEGPEKPIRFYARPWINSSRWVKTDDVHRANTALAGPGFWPAEWRVFVHKGVVQGVSSYYCWAGQATPEAAKFALEAVTLTEKIIAKAAERMITPVFMPIEFMRLSPKYDENFPDYPPDTLSFTLDFLETAQGLMVLEGGPLWHPRGGAHPCGFAGISPQGVALTSMPDVNLADPKTWRETDRTGAIFTWEAAKTLANQASRAVPTPG